MILKDFAGLVDFAESGGWEPNWEMRWFGGLASRVDCKCKGVNIGKSERMNVVCKPTARGVEADSKTKERRKREKRSGGGHVDLVVRNVRFGNLGWLLVGLARIWARIDFVRLTASPVPTNGMRRLFSNPGVTSSHHHRLIIVSIISMRWWSAHAAFSLFHRFRILKGCGPWELKDPLRVTYSEAVCRVSSVGISLSVGRCQP